MKREISLDDFIDVLIRARDATRVVAGVENRIADLERQKAALENKVGELQTGLQQMVKEFEQKGRSLEAAYQAKHEALSTTFDAAATAARAELETIQVAIRRTQAQFEADHTEQQRQLHDLFALKEQAQQSLDALRRGIHDAQQQAARMAALGTKS